MTETQQRQLIDPELLDAFLSHLGLQARPTVTGHDLTSLYFRWCEAMPYDNGRIRQSLYRHPGKPVSSASVEELLSANIADGRSGVCTETAEALYCVLKDLGFDAHLCLSYQGGATDEGLAANHISVLVRVADRFYIVDTGLLSGLPIPLRTHEAMYTPLVYSVSQDALGSWQIRTVSAVSRAPIVQRLLYLTQDRSVCQRVFAENQKSGFTDHNSSYSGRRSVRGEIVTLAASDSKPGVLVLHQTSILGTASVECHTDEERRHAMTEGLGFSAAYALELPPDTPEEFDRTGKPAVLSDRTGKPAVLSDRSVATL